MWASFIFFGGVDNFFPHGEVAGFGCSRMSRWRIRGWINRCLSNDSYSTDSHYRDPDSRWRLVPSRRNNCSPTLTCICSTQPVCDWLNFAHHPETLLSASNEKEVGEGNKSAIDSIIPQSSVLSLVYRAFKIDPRQGLHVDSATTTPELLRGFPQRCGLVNWVDGQWQSLGRFRGSLTMLYVPGALSGAGPK